MSFRPVSSDNSYQTNWGQVNDMIRSLNHEQTVKTFKQPGGANAVINGKLPFEGGYGSLYYDTSGVARILIGINPDGGIGLYVSKEGEDVIADVFS